jgi:hypothetical protein
MGQGSVVIRALARPGIIRISCQSLRKLSSRDEYRAASTPDRLDCRTCGMAYSSFI